MLRAKNIYFARLYIIHTIYVDMFYYYYYMYAHDIWGVSWHRYGGEKTALWKQFSPSTFTWVPELGWSG